MKGALEQKKFKSDFKLVGQSKGVLKLFLSCRKIVVGCVIADDFFPGFLRLI